LDVIVIDNNSSDNTVEYIKNNYPEVIIIENKQNQGFGRANNIGFEYALSVNADYVYLLNQDAWVEPDTISGLIDIMQQDARRVIVSPMQLNGKGDKLDKNFQELLQPLNCENIINDLYFGNSKHFYPAKSVMAAHWLLKTSVLRLTGGFSPVFDHYGEDNNLIHRIIYHGFEVGICPLYKGFHDREEREVANAKKIYLQYTQLLIFASDINRRFLFSYFRYYISLLTVTIRNISSAGDLKYLIKSITDIPRVLRYRDITKRKGPHFL